MGDTVSDLVAGLQRVNARRAASRAAPQVTSIGVRTSGVDGGRCEAAIPPLSSGFAFAAWLRLTTCSMLRALAVSEVGES